MSSNRPAAPTPAAERLHFRPQRASSLRLPLMLLALGVLLGLLALGLGWRQGLSSMLPFLLPCLGLLALGLWLAHRAWPCRPVLILAPGKGLTAPRWKRGLSWSLIEDVEPLLTPRGTDSVLALHLSAQAPWPLPGRAPRAKTGQRVLRIALGALSVPMQQQLSQSVLHDFAAHRVRKGLPPETPRAQQERAGQALLQQLRQDMPQPWTLWFIGAFLISLWLLNIALGLDPVSPDPLALFHWGGNSTYAVVVHREYWRLFSASALHVGWLHLALNLLALWLVAPMLNRLYGHARFLLIYLGSALAGSALSLHFGAKQSVAVGASGAVFGVLGALLLCLWRNRHRLPPSTVHSQILNLTVMAGYALAQGFTQAYVDNAAHVGGLLMGAALGAALPDRLSQPQSRHHPQQRDAQALALLLAVVCALTLSASRSGSVNFEALGRWLQRLPTLAQTLEDINRPLPANLNALQAGQLSPDALAHTLRQRDIPELYSLLWQLEHYPGTGHVWTDTLAQRLQALAQTEMQLRQGLLKLITQPQDAAQLHTESTLERLMQQRAAQRQALEKLVESTPAQAP